MQELGVFNERFELILTKSSVLSTEELTSNSTDLILVNQENSIDISTTDGTLVKNFQAYDILVN